MLPKYKKIVCMSVLRTRIVQAKYVRMRYKKQTQHMHTQKQSPCHSQPSVANLWQLAHCAQCNSRSLPLQCQRNCGWRFVLELISSTAKGCWSIYRHLLKHAVVWLLSLPASCFSVSCYQEGEHLITALQQIVLRQRAG